MNAPIPAAKLYRPAPRPRSIARRRLIDKLNQGLYRRLTLIAAPAGYGKTTLVSQWLDSCGRQVAWLSLEEADGNAARFLIGWFSALRTIQADLGTGLLAVLQSSQPPPIRPLLDAVSAELAALSTPCVLVLDDYHAAASPEVDELLQLLLERMPPSLHLALTTREEPRLPLARLRARDQLTELRISDLRFTAEETERFLKQEMPLKLSREQMAALESGTEGWVAGLHLAVLSLQGEPDVEQVIRSFAGTHRYVLDYLVEEVLRRQPEEVQSFLLRTSILDRLCGSLCEALLPEPGSESHAEERLTELEAKNVFIVPLDQERRWYRYHHLFADLLRGRLRSRCTEAEIEELHLRASLWHERHGDEIEAFRHASRSGDTDRAAHLLEGGGMPLHLRGASGEALSWLESLPAQALDARPSLWAIYGSALLMAGRLTGVEAKLLTAEAAIGDGAQLLERDSLRGWIGLIAATRAAVASLSLAGADRVQPGSGSDLGLYEAEWSLQGSAADSGDRTDALIGRIAPGGVVKRSAKAPNGRSDMDEIRFQCRRALEYLRPDPLPIRLASAWMLGVACEAVGDRSAARAAYREAAAGSRLLGEPLLAVTAAVGLGRLDEAEQQLRSAEAHYGQAIRLAGSLPIPAVQEARSGLERVSRAGTGSPDPLTPRELDVLKLVAEGLSNREIGERLFLSLDTVKGHNRRIFEKLQVQRRTEAVARANEWNLLADDRLDNPH